MAKLLPDVKLMLAKYDAMIAMVEKAASLIVTADGEELRARPADVLPLAQRYFLF